MSFLESCGRCVFPRYNSGVCPVLGRPPTQYDHPCQQYCSEAVTCQSCGAIIPAKTTIFLSEKEEFIPLCSNCSAYVNLCPTCNQRENCAQFGTNCSEWQIGGKQE